MTFLGSLMFQTLFYGWSLVMGFLMLPLLAAPRPWTVAAGRCWTRVTLWLLAHTAGLSHQVRGREKIPPGRVLYAFKHQSAWDTLVVNLLVRDPAIVVKRELLVIPLFGWYMRKAGMVGIDRATGASALRKMVAAAREFSEAGRPVVAFPEGTRSAVDAAPRYHSGIFAIYAALGVPVVPVALNSGLFWARREFAKRSGRITVEFLDPIPPGLARRDFMAMLEGRIETATRELVAAARMPPE